MNQEQSRQAIEKMSYEEIAKEFKNDWNSNLADRLEKISQISPHAVLSVFYRFVGSGYFYLQ